MNGIVQPDKEAEKAFRKMLKDSVKKMGAKRILIWMLRIRDWLIYLKILVLYWRKWITIR